MNVVGGVPRDLARFLREARRGKTRIDLDLKRLDSFGRQLDRTLDRVTVGILTASLVIGSAIVLTVRDGPTLWGIPVLPALGPARLCAGVLEQPVDRLRDLALRPGISRSNTEPNSGPGPELRQRVAALTPNSVYALPPSFGMNLSATPLLHQRWLVGGGPSSNTWPWWPPQRLQWYSVRG